MRILDTVLNFLCNTKNINMCQTKTTSCFLIRVKLRETSNAETAAILQELNETVLSSWNAPGSWLRNFMIRFEEKIWAQSFASLGTLSRLTFSQLGREEQQIWRFSGSGRRKFQWISWRCEDWPRFVVLFHGIHHPLMQMCNRFQIFLTLFVCIRLHQAKDSVRGFHWETKGCDSWVLVISDQKFTQISA